MNEFEDVLITIQMKNDSEIAESCFTVTMTDTKAYALLDKIRGWHTDIGEDVLTMIRRIAEANAYLMGYHLINVARAEILH